MKRNRVTALFAALLLCLCVLAGCGEDDYPIRPDKPNAATSSDSGSEAGQEQGEQERQEENIPAGTVFSPPPVKAGKYQMETSSLQKFDYLYGGQTYQSLSEDIRYIYNIDMSKEKNGWKAEFSFARIYYTSVSAGNSSVLFDTQDESYKDDSTAPWYNLVGQKFTVKYDEKLQVKSISGVDKILQKYPDTAEITSADSLKAIAAEAIFALPDMEYKKPFDKTHMVSDSQDVDLTYTPVKQSGRLLRLDVSTEAQPVLPADESDEAGTIHYTSGDKLSGTLWINLDNRMLFESTKIIKYYSELTPTADEGDNQQTVVFDCVITISNTSTCAARK
ncbi:MAG: DUF6263 family protein [Oscillospiraceae bacterium]|jgi:hypothetical protein|nr:DUF6263 family protein [Oscillospiraceae bacterium]